jgi:hypothetical protein
MQTRHASLSKRRVFVSSTWEDLQIERQAVEHALNRMRDIIEFSGMEYFGSRPDKPKDVCLREVGESNVYVGIFAHRYGSVDNESGMSMTELEYRKARGVGVPCLIYLKRDDERDTREANAENAAKLQALKRELMREHVVTFFRNPDHLATTVILDLYHLIKTNQLPAATRQIAPTDLRLILSLHFDLEEFRTLCFDLGIDFDNLRGEGKEAKARELVA